MKPFSRKFVVALFFAGSALGQQQNQQLSAGAKPTTSQPTAQEEHGMRQMQMEMHSPQDVTSNVSTVQEPENPDQKTGSNLPAPDLLQAAKAAPPKILSDFEALALKNNPTLKQAQTVVQTASALARQVGLWPNPSVGYQGEQIRGGSFHGGEQGGFLQQDIILGGKLGLRRNVLSSSAKLTRPLQKSRSSAFAVRSKSISTLLFPNCELSKYNAIC